MDTKDNQDHVTFSHGVSPERKRSSNVMDSVRRAYPSLTLSFPRFYRSYRAVDLMECFALISERNDKCSGSAADIFSARALDFSYFLFFFSFFLSFFFFFFFFLLGNFRRRVSAHEPLPPPPPSLASLRAELVSFSLFIYLFILFIYFSLSLSNVCFNTRTRN